MADNDIIDYQAPAPAPELKQLDFLVGKWEVEGTIKETQYGPAGNVGGWHSWKWMKGGYFLEHRWEQELGEGAEYIGFDATNNRFHSHYFESNGPYDEAGSTYEGAMRNNNFVQCGPARITYTPSADGKTMRVTSDLSPTGEVQGLDAPDSEWTAWLEATYTKVG